MPQHIPSADELRDAADRLEERTLAAEAMAPPLQIGDAQNFPRPDPADRFMVAGTGLAAEEAARAVGELRDLAATMEAGGEVTPTMLATVQRYLRP